MESKFKITTIMLLLFLLLGVTSQKVEAQGASVSFQVFYDDLSPYGTWVDNPEYGYVWIPNVSPGFMPYSTNGYWLLTDDGWTWVSNYPWGWAPFHYGRWYVDDIYGPIWVPDYEWSPGWVIWRSSPNYYGWAPLGPGISIDIAIGNGYNVPFNRWTFVRSSDFGRRNLYHYYVNSSYNVTIYNKSAIIHNTRVDRMHNVTYHPGPDRFEVEHRSGRKYNPYMIRESNKPGQNLGKNEFHIYRPQVQRNISNETRPAPSRVEHLQNLKTRDQRSAENQHQNTNQINRKQPAQQTHNTQTNRQPTDKHQQNTPQNRQQPSQQHQQNTQQKRQQPAQQQHQQNAPQNKQQPAQQHQNTQQNRQQNVRQPAHQQNSNQPTRQKSQQQNNQSNNKGGEKHKH